MTDISKQLIEFDIDQSNMPKHIALIMDGNGRWAQKHHQLRMYGHKKGVDALKGVIDCCLQIKIQYLTAWVFSTANWKRPKDEINGLMNIMRNLFQKDLKELHEKGIKLTFIGNSNDVPSDLQELIAQATEITKNNTALNLVLAFNYDGRDDILHATKVAAKLLQDNKITIDKLDEHYFDSLLMTKGVPDPDLLIRTSGVVRLSNFAMWQCAFTELVFLKKNWPEFTSHDLLQCIKDFQSRERKFGQISCKV